MTGLVQGRPVIACIAMVRDEQDILPGFLGHVSKLFDFALFVDHLSADGSFAKLDRASASWTGLQVWRLNATGYWQSAVMAALAQEAFRRGADWVVPLDADEFLGVADRPELEAILSAANGHVAFFRWRHAVPHDDVLEGRTPLSWPLRTLLVNPSPGKPGQGKVAVHRQIAEAFPHFLFSPGNQRLIPCPFAKPQTGPDAGIIWHLPVRTRRQFIGKLRRDLASHTSRDGRAVPGMGFARQVKQALLETLSKAPLDTDALRKVALGYWEIGLECLSSTIERPAAIQISVDFVTSPFIAETAAPHHEPVYAQNEFLSDVDNVSMVVAHLSEKHVVIHPAGRVSRIAAVAEIWLEKNLTPGFRLARFLAGRWVSLRLAISRRSRLRGRN
ncbi:MAG: glycosyltransferase family 2 protein [Roseomonas sp.]|nr:glycosyltransferase family 2 protein [Roseomonas sp.]